MPAAPGPARPENPPSVDAGTGWRAAPAWVLAYVALWPAPGYAEAVLALGALAALAVLGSARLRGAPAALGRPALVLATLVFAAYWLPQAVSSFDVPEARGKALAALRYLPFLWLLGMAVASPSGRRVTFGGLAVIVGAWTLDALVQAVAGTSPLFWSVDHLKLLIGGHPMCTAAQVAAVDRLAGFLGPCNVKLGQVMASMAPFALVAAARCWRAAGWLAAAVAVGIVVLLAGSRASWITYALVALATGWPLLGGRRIALLAVCGVLGAALLVAVSPQLRERGARTLLAFSGRADGVDEALSGRGQIWEAAACMIREHPLNGVGVRRFREAFPACDPLHGRGAAWGEGSALHAHQWVLEVLSETGAIGLLCWLAGILVLCRAWRTAPAFAREQARPATLALAVTVFPLNTHLAFHSAFWGGVLMLLAGLCTGALAAREAPPR